MTKLKAEDPTGALPLFEASLTASRQEGDAHGIAVNLFQIGQCLLMAGKPSEARERLREGLEAAQDLGKDDLLRAMQQLATMAAQLESMMTGDATESGPDE